MSNLKVICKVDLGSSLLDDEYTLYDNGQVQKYYDRNQWSLNNEDWLEAKTLSDYIKKKLLDKCSEELKVRAKELLYPISD